MKSILVKIFFCVISLNVVQSQISGQLFQYDLDFSLPGANIYLKGDKKVIQSDFDGFFELPIPTDHEKSDLIMSFGELTLEINNIALDNKEINLGKIILPEFRSIEIDEYEKLTQSEKENCMPIYCWAELLGYLMMDKLKDDYLQLNCSNKITDFEYDSKSKTVKIDWAIIKDCQ